MKLWWEYLTKFHKLVGESFNILLGVISYSVLESILWLFRSGDFIFQICIVIILFLNNNKRKFRLSRILRRGGKKFAKNIRNFAIILDLKIRRFSVGSLKYVFLKLMDFNKKHQKK